VRFLFQDQFTQFTHGPSSFRVFGVFRGLLYDSAQQCANQGQSTPSGHEIDDAEGVFHTSPGQRPGFSPQETVSSAESAMSSTA
jgi:hypothetical protein